MTNKKAFDISRHRLRGIGKLKDDDALMRGLKELVFWWYDDINEGYVELFFDEFSFVLGTHREVDVKVFKSPHGFLGVMRELGILEAKVRVVNLPKSGGGIEPITS